jgi:uncharacterized membrane protein YhfC
MKKIMLLILLLTLPDYVFGRTLLEYRGQENLAQDTSYYEFNFSMTENGSRMIMDLRSELDQGELNVWFGGAGYEVIGHYTGRDRFEYERVVFGPLNNQEPVTVRITTSKATGQWQLKFREISTQAVLVSILISGCLVLLVVFGIVAWWRKNTKVSWRWLFVGAGVWFVGVILKFVVANYANATVLATIDSSMSRLGYLVLGSGYIGLLTGVFEIGITLVFALLIKHMWENAPHALSVGLGAGLVEAMLIGFSSVGNYFMVVAGSAHSDAILNALTQAAAVTPLLWLISPVERCIAILCHTSSRMLVLFCVARHKPRYFWAGFLLMTMLDALAGYFHLAGLLNKVSTWWVELLLVPFAIISILIIKWILKRWQDTDSEGFQDQGIKVTLN